MRLFAFLLLAVWPVCAAESRPAWPFWDGSESIEQYAHRANLPPTRTLELGGGVNMELVLIPAGMFTQGVPKTHHPSRRHESA